MRPRRKTHARSKRSAALDRHNNQREHEQYWSDFEKRCRAESIVTFVYANGEKARRTAMDLRLSGRSPETGEDRVLITPPPIVLR